MGNAKRAVVCTAAGAVLLLTLGTGPGFAQSTGDGVWNPFKWLDPAPRRKEPQADRANLDRPKPPRVRSGPVESSDLAPVMAPDRSGLPLDLWRGLSMADLEGLLASLDLPPRSPALHQLWRRMLLFSASPPAGANPDQFTALRLEALYRSGMLDAMDDAVRADASSSSLTRAILARRDIGFGARDAACAAARSLAAANADLRGRLRGEVQLLVGYCATVAGDAAGAGLAATLAREEGVTDDLALTILDGVSMGAKVRPALPSRVSLLGYRLLQLMGPVTDAQLVSKAEPALLVALAGAPTSDLRMRTAAAEAALRINAVPPEAVADIYRREAEPAGRPPRSGAEPVDPILRRAQLFRAVETTQAPELRSRLMRALLDDARRQGIHEQTARMLAPLVAQTWPLPDLAVLAEPVVEITVAAGEYEHARRWAESAPSLQHWLALIDLADPKPDRRGRSGLASVEVLASRGRLNAETLHRLATILDALDLEVPMGLWEAAGRTPQPTSGYLPETGVLAELQQAAQRKEAGRAVLIAMRALGPNGPEGANILALGDTVKALKRAGLEADARRLAVEALLALWPRTSG
jgi:hypothetical protein